MNLFAMMETSGGAMQAERMRAEVVAANMANAETTRTATGGPYRRQHVLFAANSGDPEFADSMTAASGTAGSATLASTPMPSLRMALGRRHRACILRPWSRTPQLRSSVTTQDILMPARMGMFPIPTLIHSQRWWT